MSKVVEMGIYAARKKEVGEGKGLICAPKKHSVGCLVHDFKEGFFGEGR